MERREDAVKGDGFLKIKCVCMCVYRYALLLFAVLSARFGMCPRRQTGLEDGSGSRCLSQTQLRRS